MPSVPLLALGENGLKLSVNVPLGPAVSVNAELVVAAVEVVDVCVLEVVDEQAASASARAVSSGTSRRWRIPDLLSSEQARSPYWSDALLKIRRLREDEMDGERTGRSTAHRDHRGNGNGAVVLARSRVQQCD